MTRLSPDDDQRVFACPSCDTVDVRENRQGDTEYRCASCGATFDEYHERDRYCTGGNPLRDVDPEEVLGA